LNLQISYLRWKGISLPAAADEGEENTGGKKGKDKKNRKWE
jgi:hypothetical protein